MNRRFMDLNEEPDGGENLLLKGFCIILLRNGGRPQAAWIIGEGRVVKVSWAQGGSSDLDARDESLGLNAWKN